MSSDRDDRRNLGADLGREGTEGSSLLGHYYRGELDRMNSWATRIDETTKWAVTIVAAIITWVFSSPDNPHYILLLGMATLAVFHVVETRRYRFYDVWRARVRLIEENLLAPLLDPRTGLEHPDWRRELSEDLRWPAVKISFLEAYDRRLRRVYLPLLLVLLAAWIVRLTAFTPGEPLGEAARIGEVPGLVVIGIVAVAYLVVVGVALWPMEREAKGELYEKGEKGKWKDEENRTE